MQFTEIRIDRGCVNKGFFSAVKWPELMLALKMANTSRVKWFKTEAFKGFLTLKDVLDILVCRNVSAGVMWLTAYGHISKWLKTQSTY